MRHLLPIAASLALAGPAMACINDTELISHEREFKSQYRESQYTPPEAQPRASAKPYLIGGTGALLAIAGGVVLYRLRANS